MSLLIRGPSQRSIDIWVEKSSGAYRTVTDDKAISEEVIDAIAQFILKTEKDELTDRGKARFRSLSIKPLSHAEVKFGIQLIKDHPNVVVVSDETNKGPGGSTYLTRELTVGVDEQNSLGVLSEGGLRVMRSNQRREKTMLGVANRIWETLQRYEKTFPREPEEEVDISTLLTAMILSGRR